MKKGPNQLSAPHGSLPAARHALVALLPALVAAMPGDARAETPDPIVPPGAQSWQTVDLPGWGELQRAKLTAQVEKRCGAPFARAIPLSVDTPKAHVIEQLRRWLRGEPSQIGGGFDVFGPFLVQLPNPASSVGLADGAKADYFPAGKGKGVGLVCSPEKDPGFPLPEKLMDKTGLTVSVPTVKEDGQVVQSGDTDTIEFSGEELEAFARIHCKDPVALVGGGWSTLMYQQSGDGSIPTMKGRDASVAASEAVGTTRKNVFMLVGNRLGQLTAAQMRGLNTAGDPRIVHVKPGKNGFEKAVALQCIAPKKRGGKPAAEGKRGNVQRNRKGRKD